MVEIGAEQFGFMPNRSTTDAIFALRQMIEKHRDGQENLHCVFIDLEKAYDRVPRQELWTCMRTAEIPEAYVRIVKDMYDDCTTRVRSTCGETENFAVTVGVHQGSALSPFLLLVVLECLTKEIRREAPWEMLFADDVVINTKTREEAELRVEGWRHALERRGMKVSRKKTEYLCTGGGLKEKGSIKIRGEAMNRVENFKYLGSTVQEDGGTEQEVMRRIQSGWNSWRKITGVVCDRRAPKWLKGKLHKQMVRPAMLYGLETVPLTKAQEKKLEVAEMRMLRYELGATWEDRIKNEDIRSALQIKETFASKIRESRLRWFGHIARREEGYVGKKVMELEVGRRKRGRPKRRWSDCTREDLKSVGADEDDARDRTRWKSIIRTGDPA